MLGLICVGECTNTQEVSELSKIHESLRSKFSGTLYDSCCLFLGLQHDGKWLNDKKFMSKNLTYLFALWKGTPYVMSAVEHSPKEKQQPVLKIKKIHPCPVKPTVLQRSPIFRLAAMLRDLDPPVLAIMIVLMKHRPL